MNDSKQKTGSNVEHADERPGGMRRRWLVLYCRSRFEFKLYAAIIAEGTEVFFPTRTELRQWTDRKKRVTVPLFPGYLFVHVNERERVSALEKPGAIKYVQFGGAMAEVSDEVVESLRIAASTPEHITVEPRRMQPGQGVVVLDGPFAGMKGTLIEARGMQRVAIEVNAIAQTVLVEVHQSSISLQ